MHMKQFCLHETDLVGSAGREGTPLWTAVIITRWPVLKQKWVQSALEGGRIGWPQASVYCRLCSSQLVVPRVTVILPMNQVVVEGGGSNKGPTSTDESLALPQRRREGFSSAAERPQRPECVSEIVSFFPDGHWEFCNWCCFLLHVDCQKAEKGARYGGSRL